MKLKGTDMFVCARVYAIMNHGNLFAVGLSSTRNNREFATNGMVPCTGQSGMVHCIAYIHTHIHMHSCIDIHIDMHTSIHKTYI